MRARTDEPPAATARARSGALPSTATSASRPEIGLPSSRSRTAPPTSATRTFDAAAARRGGWRAAARPRGRRASLAASFKDVLDGVFSGERADLAREPGRKRDAHGVGRAQGRLELAGPEEADRDGSRSGMGFQAVLEPREHPFIREREVHA